MSAKPLILRHGKIEQRIFFAAVEAIPAAGFLSADEAAQAAGFQFAEKKQGFLTGRLAAKRALGALLDEPDLRQIEIRSGIYGQPLVHHPRAGSAEVTVSHSHGLAVALAYPAECPMGIDLETLSAVATETVIGALEASPPELTWLATAGVDPATACCVLWTAREALGKALRIGLNSPLGILALADIQDDGAGGWSGHYLNFPQSRCQSQVKGGRVLTLSMPRAAALSGSLL